MDYGKRSYGSPANNHPTFIQEITDQYIQSIGGIWPADFKRPYVYSSFQEMQYLFNSPVVYTGGEAPLLEDLDVELDPLIPVPSDPYDPVIPPVWPTPTPPPIPDDEDEEEDECICGGAYIQYTTLQMQKNEEQTLVVRGDRNCLYTWAITSGGGAFEYYTTDNKHAIGAEVIYIAPSSNANCSDNATITLYCNGAYANAITITVNADTYASPVGQISYWQLTALIYVYGYYATVACQSHYVYCAGNTRLFASNSAQRGPHATASDAIEAAKGGCGALVFKGSNPWDVWVAGAGYAARKVLGCCPTQLL